MPINKLSDEQRKIYFRDAKRRSREKQNAGRVQDFRDWELPEKQQQILDKRCSEVLETIQFELQPYILSGQDKYIVETVSDVVVGFEQHFIQKIQNSSFLVAGYFADACASAAIRHVHIQNKLLDSPTFKSLYHQFLIAVESWSQKHAQSADPACIADIRSELLGQYKLRDPQPVREPANNAEFPVATDAEILETGRSKLLQQLTGL